MRSVTNEQFQSKDSATHVVKVILERDNLTIWNEAYADLRSLVTTRRGASESFKNYESRFAALMSGFNAHELSPRLPEPILAYMPMTSAGIADNHRVSILAGASNDLCINEEGEWIFKSNPDNVNNVQYETVASILQQC